MFNTSTFQYCFRSFYPFGRYLFFAHWVWNWHFVGYLGMARPRSTCIISKTCISNTNTNSPNRPAFPVASVAVVPSQRRWRWDWPLHWGRRGGGIRTNSKHGDHGPPFVHIETGYSTYAKQSFGCLTPVLFTSRYFGPKTLVQGSAPAIGFPSKCLDLSFASSVPGSVQFLNTRGNVTVRMTATVIRTLSFSVKKRGVVSQQTKTIFSWY